MFEKRELTIHAKCDNLPLSVLQIIPKETCKGVIQILHGMSEYKERYIPFMEFLAQHGYASVIHDHRGHGKSVKDIEDLGYMYEVGVKGFISDVKVVNAYARQLVPNVPLAVFGHSMGTLAARVFMKLDDMAMDAIVLSGPPCENPVVDMGLMLAQVQKKIKGPKTPGKLLEKISFGGYAAAFAEEKNVFAWLNSDKEAVAAYEADPYCGFTFTFDGYLVLLKLLKYTYEKKHWACKNPEMPVLFLGGDKDPCISGEKKFADMMLFLEQVGYKKVNGHLYEGMRHEILQEPGRMEVYEDILNFLNNEVVSSPNL